MFPFLELSDSLVYRSVRSSVSDRNLVGKASNDAVAV